MANANLIFVGAGGFAKELYYWMLPHLPKDVSIKGFLSANPKDLANEPKLPPHLGKIEEYQPLTGDQFVMAIGNIQVKMKFAELLKAKGANFYSFIHPSSVVTPTASIGEACIVSPFCVISHNAKIGDFVTLNTHCAVGHDSSIGDFAILSPMSGIMGAAQLGKGVFLGANSFVGPKVSVGEGSIISGGCTILKNVKDGQIASPQFPKIMDWIRKS